MRSTVSVEVTAPAQLVFRLARDVERWPRLLPHYVLVRAVERRSDGTLVAEMVARTRT
jgi:ribosome-associated toxin RatA of RatAB toxin-antitoxin module